MNGRNWLIGAVACAALLGATQTAFADKIKHTMAVFAGLDKITGRIITFDVAIDETVQFGSLQITPRTCYSRPPTEAPQTDVFAEVDEAQADKSLHRIFTGWMFADSPGMHGIEHPVYDIWLTDCKGGAQVIHEAPAVADAPTSDTSDADIPVAPAPAPAATPAPKKRKPPKPAANAVDAVPLDLGAGPPPPLPGPATTPAPAAPRNPPARRFFPTDAAPIPPADVGQ